MNLNFENKGGNFSRDANYYLRKYKIENTFLTNQKLIKNK